VVYWCTYGTNKWQNSCRDWEGHAPCPIGTSKSIVAHWGPLSMRPCAPCKLWLIILLFHVSIKVVNFPLMVVPWFSLSIFRTVICVNQSDKGFTLSILNLVYLKHICPDVSFSFLNNWSILVECILLSGWIESNYN
jgi:hypothetical protein